MSSLPAGPTDEDEPPLTLQEWGKQLQRDVVIEHLHAWGPFCFLYDDDEGEQSEPPLGADLTIK